MPYDCSGMSGPLKALFLMFRTYCVRTFLVRIILLSPLQCYPNLIKMALASFLGSFSRSRNVALPPQKQRREAEQPDAETEPAPGSDQRVRGQLQQLGRYLQPGAVQEEAEVDGLFVLAAGRWEPVFKVSRGRDCGTEVECKPSDQGLRVSKFESRLILGSYFF